MKHKLPVLFAVLLLFQGSLEAQDDKLGYLFTGVVYDEYFRPLPHTHVVASGTGMGDITDSLGIFSLYIRKYDQLSFFHISFKEAMRFVSIHDQGFYIILKKRYYSLPEARIYDWGSSYEDFLDEVERRGTVVTKGEKLRLPRQDPDHIPFEMDESVLKSAGFMISSPISFLYYNLSRREKSARKAYWLERNKEKIEQFERVLAKENIGDITGLGGAELESFIIYLNKHLQCDYDCSELELILEIHKIWDSYKK